MENKINAQYEQINELFQYITTENYELANSLFCRKFRENRKEMEHCSEDIANRNAISLALLFVYECGRIAGKREDRARRA